VKARLNVSIAKVWEGIDGCYITASPPILISIFVISWYCRPTQQTSSRGYYFGIA
jgi:hypothetical protein